MATVADRLRQLMGDLSRAEFARKCGVQDSSIRQYLSGKSLPSLENLIAISRATGASLDWIATGLASQKYTDMVEQFFVTRLSLRASAGRGAYVLVEEPSSIALPLSLIQHLGVSATNLRALEAVGDSMLPTIANGDLMLINIGAREFTDGRIFVLTIGDEVFVKRLRRNVGKMMMFSDNDAFPPEPIPPEETVQIIGRVVWSGQQL